MSRKIFSHSLTETSNHNYFTSNVDQKTFAFVKTRDNSDKKRAYRELQQHIRELEEAENARIANDIPDTRSTSQKIRDGEAKVHKNSGVSKSDSTRARIAELERRNTLPFISKSEKGANQRSIENYRRMLVEQESTELQEAERSARMNSPEFLAAISEGEAFLQTLLKRSDVSKTIVDGAELAVAELRKEGNLHLWTLKKASIEKFLNIEQDRLNANIDRKIAESTEKLESQRPEKIV